MSVDPAINPSVMPSGPGCVECDETGNWWVQLRRCATCGHIGCCDSSPGQHATGHYQQTGHPIMRTYEPGDDWWWDYRTGDYTTGGPLASPLHHPEDQPTPGPEGRVPPNWRELVQH